MPYHRFIDEETGDTHGSFEVFHDNANEVHGHIRNFGSDGEPVKAGWYWWACFPGCLPDGELCGPFNTSAEAYDDAQDGA